MSILPNREGATLTSKNCQSNVHVLTTPRLPRRQMWNHSRLSPLLAVFKIIRMTRVRNWWRECNSIIPRDLRRIRRIDYCLIRFVKRALNSAILL